MTTARRARLLALSSLAALAVVLLGSDPARAHAVFVGQSKILQEGATVRYELALNYDELAKRVRLGAPGAVGPGARDVPVAQREAALRAARPRLQSYVEEHVRVLADGTACAHTLQSVEVVPYRVEIFAVLSSVYECPGSGAASYTVDYDAFFDAVSGDERAAHANVADYELGAAAGRFVFEAGTQRLGVGGPGAASGGGPSVEPAPEPALAGLGPAQPLLVVLLVPLALLARRLRRSPPAQHPGQSLRDRHTRRI